MQLVAFWFQNDFKENTFSGANFYQFLMSIFGVVKKIAQEIMYSVDRTAIPC